MLGKIGGSEEQKSKEFEGWKTRRGDHKISQSED
jgi:hypothetical protein